MKKVVIVGGGITGLTAMYYLQKVSREQNLDIELVLIERDQQLGGKIRTITEGDFIMEAGADSIVARNEGVLPLVNELHLQNELVYNETGTSYIYTNGELHRIPPDTIFGIPMSIEALYESTLISEAGKKAALLDLETKNTVFTKESSIGEFLEAFLGKELVENQIAPVLSGVYSGSLYKLTMASTLPYLFDYKNEYGSIIKGLSANRQKFKGSSNKKFISFRHGLSTIIDRLEEECGDAMILKGTEIKSLHMSAGKYELTLNGHESIQADYVIFATPHDVTQQILKHEKLDKYFNALRNSSLLSIYLGFNVPDEMLPADGTGFIVSKGSEVKCNACTWTSRKWKHTSRNHNLLVRLFYKSTNTYYDQLKNLREEELTGVALEDIKRTVGIDADPVSIEVTKWDNLMPNYHLGHNQSVNALNEILLTEMPQVKLAGASYFGVGIGACIQNGKETAESIMKDAINKA
ncbi:protoporphyrinogen oxidase [Bacillus sp. es.034]|jgi:protoporphyrinogen/coproporphyrinogen III oxidase|uniref:protoporphyrinogen oxidase n=1 Tax=Bacillus sp. es.034 TaxID=1761763 RepID=UPI000BF4E451|nr:protoporphyrinogen oxidase [Bacillus sp. es.034]PFG06428.1 oxygen-dependent protoporphyrinogen oxidase [Bacillus sp. es.034]